MKKIYKYTISSLIMLASSLVSANVILETNRTSFENLGSIEFNYGFENFNSSTFSYPSTPYTSNGVTYTSAQNLILGATGTPYTTNGTNMMTNNYWNPITGTIDSTVHSLFGFDAGWSSQDDNGTVMTITTNLSSYLFNVDLNSASQAGFYGFVADAGEYFTSFNINTNTFNALASIDNVTLGQNGNAPAQVPEPTAIALMGLGLLGFGFSRRKLQK